MTYKIETLVVHAGYFPDPITKSVAVPIYQTVAYAFDNAQHGADLFDLKVEGNIYTRVTNPTNAILEERLTALEGGIGSLVLASGAAAITYAIQTIAENGDNIISANKLYGGTYNLFAHTLPTFGIETKFFNPQSPEEIHNLVNEKTKLVFIESIGNPAGNVPNIQKIAEIAHKNNIPLIVDNTVATPYLLRPFEFGADIVIHSLTKYLGGHGNSLGGSITDSGKFPWHENKEKFRRLNEPDPSYHGVIFTEALKEAAFIGRARVIPLRNTGAALSPFNSFLILQGIETLHLRVERITENTLKIAQFLQKHEKINNVIYAGLDNHEDYEITKRLLNGKASGLLSFELKGNNKEEQLKNGIKFLDSLKLFTLLVNIGDSKSLATQPASTTHRQLNSEELKQAGVSEGLIRLSIGIEHIDDLLEDLNQALNQI